MSILQTRNLSRSFAGLLAVDDVNLTVEPGQIRALIGPNGAGKTTLVSLICGRIPASSGTVIFDGQDVSALPAHARIRAGMAYTFQITSIFKNLTARENVALSAQRIFGGRGPQLDDTVDQALARVNLSGHAEAVSGTLSYGHQRLLEIAMGLGQNPKLLILDEPTQGLAASEISGFISLIRGVAQDATVLLIEHNMDVVMELAEQITVLDMGRIIAEGTPRDIQRNDAVQAAYLGG